MDRLLSLLVRMLVWISRYAKPLAKMGIGAYAEWKPGEKIKLLLVGYNGARNTGADARVVAIVKQLREIFGAEQIRISVATLDKEALKGYFPPDVTLLQFSSIFLLDLYRACSTHHAAILCEGSTLKSTFADALTLYFCEAAGIMRGQNKPCIAYGSEVGQMAPYLQKTAASLCRDTWFITRTETSYRELRRLGLNGHVGTDTAWCYDQAISREEAHALLRRAGWDGASPLLGIAPIHPFCWPVRPSLTKWLRSVLTGDTAGQYDKWYFFSDSPARRAAYENYLSAIAQAIRRLLEEQTFFPVLLGMERLDAGTCAALQEKLQTPCAVFLSESYTAAEMTGILRSLSVLLTSRYHAAVLSMPQRIPFVALSMDERLDGILRELSLEEKYLLHVTDTDLEQKIYDSLTAALRERAGIAEKIGAQYGVYQDKLRGMGGFLKSYIECGLDRKQKGCGSP